MRAYDRGGRGGPERGDGEDPPVARPQPRRGPAGPRPAAGCLHGKRGVARSAVVPARSDRHPADCTATATSGDDVARALADAAAGSTICVTGDGLRDADLAVGTSGTADRPVTLAGEGSTPVRAVIVSADHVVVQGFAAVGG